MLECPEEYPIVITISVSSALRSFFSSSSFSKSSQQERGYLHLCIQPQGTLSQPRDYPSLPVPSLLILPGRLIHPSRGFLPAEQCLMPPPHKRLALLLLLQLNMLPSTALHSSCPGLFCRLQHHVHGGSISLWQLVEEGIAQTHSLPLALHDLRLQPSHR